MNPLNNKEYSKNYYNIKKKIDKLPSSNKKIKKQLFKLIDEEDLIILEAETGAGKSVNIPQIILKEYLLEKNPSDNNINIVVTQPRTLNAKNIASFVAKIVDVKLGEEVGYKYRHYNVTSNKTMLSYVTDGTLVQEIYKKHGDFNYDFVIIDEVHERTVSIDILLALIKQYLYSTDTLKEKKCKFIVMSATLDVELFYKYYKNVAKIGTLQIPGRAFPVKVHYLKESVDQKYDNILFNKLNKILDISESGDILVFLESKTQINKLCYKINKEYSSKKVLCLGLYRGITPEQQQLVVDKDQFKIEVHGVNEEYKRKIVLSTNIAESGITIENVRFVIDTGLKYEMVYKDRTNILQRVFISKDSAEQRKGRAGRVSSGVCYRLYTKDEYNDFEIRKSPEILVSNIDTTLISLLNTNFIINLNQLGCFLDSLITPPHLKQVQDSLKYLYQLGIIKSNCNTIEEFSIMCRKKNSKTKKMKCFTFLGECISKLPLEPAFAVALLASYNYNVFNEVLIIVSMLSIESNVGKWFVKPNIKENSKIRQFEKSIKKYQNSKSDLMVLLKIYYKSKKIDSHKVKKWAKKNFIYYPNLMNANKNIKQIKQSFDKINVSCRIEKIANISDDQNTNIINAFLHGFFNQLALKNKYNNKMYNIIDGCDKDIYIKAGRNNNLTKLNNVIAFIEHANILGNESLNGLTNVSKNTLKSMYDIAPHYFKKDKITI